MIGETIDGRYRCLRVLGQGGMGAVYEAEHTGTGRRVAVKVIHADMVKKTEMVLRFHREARVAGSIETPHIVQVLDTGTDPATGTVYMVMEFLRGEDMQQLIRRLGKVPALVALRLIAQACVGLSKAHAASVIHRDIKPANVLVTNGQVKVLDFGLSVQSGQTALSGGTLAYLAPELLKDAPASVSSDLYAVGIIAYQILAGRYPFPATALHHLLEMIQSGQPDLSLIDAPEMTRRFVAILLAKQPEARYRSTTEAIDALVMAFGLPRVEQTDMRESYLHAARFIGREPERALVLSALEQAHGGHGALWLIEGESGVGKSRFIGEVATAALLAGVAVLRGGASNAGPLLGIWREPLRRLAVFQGMTITQAAVLGEIVPDLAHLLERTITPAQISIPLVQFTIAALLKHSEEPLLIILEDLQWADDSSVQVLRYLSARLQTTRVLILATFRTGEKPRLLEPLDGIPTIRLPRLQPQEIIALSSSILGEETGVTPLAAFLTRESEGNILFIIEILRNLTYREGGLDAISFATLPASMLTGGISHLLAQRLKAVPIADRQALELAALIARTLDLRLLAHILPDLPLERWLVDNAERSIIVAREGAYEFSHDKLRETLLASLDVARARDMHRQIALAIEAVYAVDAERAAALADHWEFAGAAEKALAYAFHAANRAREMCAAFDQVLRLLDRLPDTPQHRRQRGEALAARTAASLVSDAAQQTPMLLMQASLGDAEDCV